MSDWKDKLKKWRKGQHTLSTADGSRKGGTEAVRHNPERPVPPHSPRRHLCLGLDFGTSSTKAVVRLLPTGPAFAVPLAGGIREAAEPYLAPTHLWIGNSGLATLEGNGTGSWVEDMKVRLMERPWAIAPAAIGAAVAARPADFAAAYLTLVLREVFNWVNDAVRPALGSAEVVWSMNVGIPARDFDDLEIRAAFATVARAAWQLAFQGGPVDIAHVAETVDAAKNENFVPRGIAAEMIEVIPEVAAGVATYARSPLKRRGPHLFVDVGATTLDASLFLLDETEDGLKYVFLAADVDANLGALRLHRHRASELGRMAGERFAASNPLKPIPPTARDCVPPDSDIDRIDSAFAESCTVKIGSVVYKAKQQARYDLSIPDSGPRDAIQVLLSGGGIQLALYQDVVREAGKRAGPGGKQGLRVRPFQSCPIPQPPELRAPNLTADSWQRLAVAYGLSFRAEDIGGFVPPSAVPPMPRASREDDRADAFISKEQV